MVKDTTHQVLLTLYYGSLLTTFIYDYVIRNIVRLYQYGVDWTYVSNIGMGGLFALVSVWAIFSVWRKIPRNLLICLIALIIIFIARLGVGVPDNMDKKRWLTEKQYAEELSIFIAQMAVHFVGIVLTWVFYSNHSTDI